MILKLNLNVKMSKSKLIEDIQTLIQYSNYKINFVSLLKNFKIIVYYLFVKMY